uniref:DNA-binding protein H-NS-like C-terminal domain-containing protein n=1 Tax=Vibrio sp. FF_291 TaxID=1652832 RepID=A0A0H3ZVS2_9VIBR|nr:hypothetical protein [Vibrio sp. FF_291]
MKKVNHPEKVCFILQDFTIDELVKYRNELDNLIKEKSAKLNDAMTKAERLKIFMAHNRMDSDVLFDTNKFKRRPKYAYFDEFGKMHTWAGVGRTPLILQKLLDEGANIEDFQIERWETELK